jgi:hypothetical protein
MGQIRSFMPVFAALPQINCLAVTKNPGKTNVVLAGFCLCLFGDAVRSVVRDIPDLRYPLDQWPLLVNIDIYGQSHPR